MKSRKMKEETKNAFNKYIRYMIVPKCRRRNYSKIILNRSPCFLSRILRNENYYEGESMIVLDSCASSKSHNNYKDVSVIKLYNCDISDNKTNHIVENEYSYCHPPVLCMIIISLIEILCFTWDAMTLKTTESIFQGCVASKLIYNPYRKNEVWRFLTYSFVHAGQTSRLTVNLIVKLLLGIPLETVHCSWRVVFVYLSGVLAASLTTSVMNPSAWLVGASGGVYALIMAHVTTVIINWSKMEFAVYQLLVFAFFITYDVGLSVHNHYFISVKNSQEIDYMSHLAGAIAGLLVGVYIFRNYCSVRSWENKLRLFSFIVYLLLIGSVVTWNIIFSEYFTNRQF